MCEIVTECKRDIVSVHLQNLIKHFWESKQKYTNWFKFALSPNSDSFQATATFRSLSRRPVLSSCTASKIHGASPSAFQDGDLSTLWNLWIWQGDIWQVGRLVSQDYVNIARKTYVFLMRSVPAQDGTHHSSGRLCWIFSLDVSGC